MDDKCEFVIGEIVRLKSGAFQSFTGRVVGVNKVERTLKVVVSIPGEWRTVELRFGEVEKAT